MMHQRIYPQLAQVCSKSSTAWNQPREREEGKRLRRLIRQVLQGRLLDPFGEGQAQVQPLEEAPVRYLVESEAITMDDNGFHAPDEAAEGRSQEAENICGQCDEHHTDTEGCWYHPGWLHRNEGGRRKWTCCERVECVQFCERGNHSSRGIYRDEFREKQPLKFRDDMGRNFLLPFHLCYTWLGMEALIKKSFLYTDVVDPRSKRGITAAGPRRRDYSTQRLGSYGERRLDGHRAYVI